MTTTASFLLLLGGGTVLVRAGLNLTTLSIFILAGCLYRCNRLRHHVETQKYICDTIFVFKWHRIIRFKLLLSCILLLIDLISCDVHLNLWSFSFDRGAIFSCVWSSSVFWLSGHKLL